MNREGLSPPTRGNHVAARAQSRAARSIPAHAGEPCTPRRSGGRRGVYPRPRGGTDAAEAESTDGYGLSPPTRGNPRRARRRSRPRRSIPAHAGEPRAGRARAARPSPRRGLSPPTRGNLAVKSSAPSGGRSIPAHAGEPGTAAQRSFSGSVYPRPRGGTTVICRVQWTSPGLSPPTRGNPRRFVPPRFLRGSIPAHAGEPLGTLIPCQIPMVYPRPRGGTPNCAARIRLRPGLSPPTRGNHTRRIP